jgi:hypothetical protein
MSEDAYISALYTYCEGGVYFQAAVKKLGLEKALQIQEDAFEMHGTGWETLINEKFPDGVDLKGWGEILLEGLVAQGFTSEVIMEDEDMMIIRNTKCPRYDGMKMAGHSDEVIKEHCLRGVRVLEKHLQKIDPDFKFGVPIWDAPNGRCDEVFTLKT